MMRGATPGSGRPRVLVNIPILNEIENIEALVTGVMRALDGHDYVLLIVDDGSTDGTLEYLEPMLTTSGGRVALLKRRKMLRGCQRGGALYAGVVWALGNGPFDVFIEMDGDLSHRTEELPRVVDAIAAGDADVVIVSKYVRGAAVHGRTVGRRLISRVCNIAVRALIRWDILDFSNGYRAYTSRAAELIPRHHIRYGSPVYLTEVMGIWLSHGLRVAEISGTYVGRKEGLSKVRMIDYVKAAIGVIEIATRFRVTGFPLAAATRSPDLSESAAASVVSEQDG